MIEVTPEEFVKQVRNASIDAVITRIEGELVLMTREGREWKLFQAEKFHARDNSEHYFLFLEIVSTSAWQAVPNSKDLIKVMP